jgi:hypothetical protein
MGPHAGIIGALESEGLSRPLDYLLIRDGQTSRTRLPDPFTGIAASPDARWVVMDRARPPHVLVYWPVDDPGRLRELAPEGDGQFWLDGWLTGSSRSVTTVGGQDARSTRRT